MQITQLRSATLVIHSGPHHILVDPMLAPRHALPPLRLLDGRRERNPTVGLPAAAAGVLEQVTHVLITHCQKGHFDHLDRAGKAWLRERQLPVICTPHDAEYLQARGLNVQVLAPGHDQPQPFLGGRIRTLRCTHGRGLVGRLMEHGVGYFIELPAEPTLYLAGDTVLTPAIVEFLQREQPDVCVLPAGGAHFDFGGELIMGVDEVLACTRLTQGLVVANHLEALSHCPVTRAELRQAAQAAGLATRLCVPEDGETLNLAAPALACAA
ncbi:MBL fold metallo-hydrolase [Inhella proteolytica]|uniref:MBL fold metallo-hydrolase n=1 Tax=Inhella proteolytica TaxID=2795029 RepID=A0A931J5I9_9BURK|nr:MBL fold metallo-hydrolase [Inhella proteolytica]MBH9579143.1 MBL fold metallo-hydrolase [Inhella proteolytica]